MKLNLTHFLLVLALFGDLFHTFHHHEHNKKSSVFSSNSCPICVVDDLSKVIHESVSIHIELEHFWQEKWQLYHACFTHFSYFHLSRAPPLFS